MVPNCENGSLSFASRIGNHKCAKLFFGRNAPRNNVQAHQLGPLTTTGSRLSHANSFQKLQTPPSLFKVSAITARVVPCFRSTRMPLIVSRSPGLCASGFRRLRGTERRLDPYPYFTDEAASPV